MLRDRVLSPYPCAGAHCGAEMVALGCACPDCCEIAAASVRAANEAPGPVPVERDVRVLSLKLPLSSVSSAGQGASSGADESAVRGGAIAHEHGGQARCTQRNAWVRAHP